MAAVNISVRARRNEPSDRLIRRFNRKCKKEGIVEKYKERCMAYVKPSEKKRIKRRKAKRQRERDEQKRQKYLKRAKYNR